MTPLDMVLVRWAKAQRLTDRLPNLSLVTARVRFVLQGSWADWRSRYTGGRDPPPPLQNVRV